MLQVIRDHAGSWFIKLLFVVIVLSFALWGVGDVIRNYAASRPILSVGNFNVSLEEFMLALRNMNTQVQSMSKGKLSPDQIKQMNLGDRVLEQYTNQGLLEEEIRQQHLIVPDAALTAHLHQIKAFQTKEGKFDPALFRQATRGQGMSEARFLHDLRQSVLQAQLLQPLAQANYLPQPYIDALLQGLQQEHVFAVVDIPASLMPAPANIDDKTLRTFYEEKNTQIFLMPETRSITLLLLNGDELKKNIAVSEAQIQEEYERRRTDFTTEEKREVTEIFISNKAKLQEAYTLLNQGEKPAVVAKALNGKVIEMGFLKLADFSPEISGKIFEGKQAPFVTQPTEDAAGGHIFIVSAIQPESQAPLSEVREKILEGLRLQAINETYDEMRTKVEDGLAGGASLAEVAKSVGLTVLTIDHITREGVDAKGKQTLPGTLTKEISQKIINQIFATSEGADTSFTEVGNGIAFVLHVNKINYAYLPELSTNRARAVAGWQQEKRRERAAEIAQELLKATTPQELEQIASKFKLKVQMLPPISRAALEKSEKMQKRFPEKFWQIIMTAPKNKAVHTITSEGFAVAMLTNIKPYDVKKDPELRKRFVETLQKMVTNDVELTFVKSISKYHKVSINQEVLALATDRSR